MANFIGLVYATLKNEGIDTKGMDTDTAVAKYNELQKKSGGKEGADQPTPAENRKMNGESPKAETKEAKGTPAEEKRLQETGIKQSNKIIDKLEKQGFKSSGKNTYKINRNGKDVTLSFTDNGKAFIVTTVSGTKFSYKDLDTAIDRAKYTSGKAPSEGAVGWETGTYNREVEDKFIRENI